LAAELLATKYEAYLPIPQIDAIIPTKHLFLIFFVFLTIWSRTMSPFELLKVKI
jgi:hypothetical protein